MTASTLTLKQMTKLAVRLAALAPVALLAAAGCDSSSTPSQSTACGNVAQCPAGQACLNNTTCVPVQTGTAGGGNVNTAGNGSVGSAAMAAWAAQAERVFRECPAVAGPLAEVSSA